MASLSTPLTESQEKLFAQMDVKYENLDLKLTPKNQDLEAQDLEEQIQQAAIDQNQSFSSEVIASIKSNFLTYLFTLTRLEAESVFLSLAGYKYMEQSLAARSQKATIDSYEIPIFVITISTFQATNILIAKSLGADKQSEVGKAILVSCMLGTALTIPIATTLFFLRDSLFNPTVAEFFEYFIWSMPFLAINSVNSQAILGLQKYTASAVIGSLRAALIYILAYCLSESYQEKGLPLALSLSNVVFSLVTTAYLFNLTSKDDVYNLKKLPTKSEIIQESKALIKVGAPLCLKELGGQLYSIFAFVKILQSLDLEDKIIAGVACPAFMLLFPIIINTIIILPEKVSNAIGDETTLTQQIKDKIKIDTAASATLQILSFIPFAIAFAGFPDKVTGLLEYLSNSSSNLSAQKEQEFRTILQIITLMMFIKSIGAIPTSILFGNKKTISPMVIDLLSNAANAFVGLYVLKGETLKNIDWGLIPVQTLNTLALIYFAYKAMDPKITHAPVAADASVSDDPEGNEAAITTTFKGLKEKRELVQDIGSIQEV